MPYEWSGNFRGIIKFNAVRNEHCSQYSNIELSKLYCFFILKHSVIIVKMQCHYKHITHQNVTYTFAASIGSHDKDAVRNLREAYNYRIT